MTVLSLESGLSDPAGTTASGFSTRWVGFRLPANFTRWVGFRLPANFTRWVGFRLPANSTRWRIVSCGVGLLLVLGLGGCSSQRGPVSELRPLLEALGAPTEPVPNLAHELLRVLDAPSRAALTERAAKLSGEAGTPIDVLHVLQPRGLSTHRRVSSVEVEDSSADTATLVVQLVPLQLAPAEGDAPAAGATETIRLAVRLEEDGWKLSLTDLAALIGRVPVVTQGDR